MLYYAAICAIANLGFGGAMDTENCGCPARRVEVFDCVQIGGSVSGIFLAI